MIIGDIYFKAFQRFDALFLRKRLYYNLLQAIWHRAILKKKSF